MPSREDETYRNIQPKHVPTCTCVDCERRRKNLPPRTKLPEPIEASEEDWQAFVNDIGNVKIPNPPPSNPAMRMDLQHRVPLEITERGRRTRDDERERMERERAAGTRARAKADTRPKPKIQSGENTKTSTRSTGRVEGWILVFLAAILIFIIAAVIATVAVN